MLTLALLLAGLTHPTAPVVAGPRTTANARPVYRFSSHEPRVPAAKLRFRCSFDQRKLHACGRRYRQRLTIGRHLLRVQAVDPAGRRSRVTKVRVRIVPRTGPRLRILEVGGRPFSLADADGSIWVANSSPGRFSASTRRRTASSRGSGSVVSRTALLSLPARSGSGTTRSTRSPASIPLRTRSSRG